MAPTPSDSESTKRPYGTGSLYPHRDGWRAEFPLANGKRTKKSFPTEEHALDWLHTQVVRRYGGNSKKATDMARENSATPDMKLAQYAEKHIEQKYRDGKLSDTTLGNYRSALALYWDEIGELPIKSVASANLRQFIESLNVIRKNGSALSYSSQHAQWRFVTTVLNAAARDGLIDSRVLTSVDFPTRQAWARTYNQLQRPPHVRPRRRTGDQARYIPESQYRRLSSALAKAPDLVCSYETHALGWCGAEGFLAITSAIRQGERLALKRGDFIPKYDQYGRVQGGTLTIRSHAVSAAWLHGCGAPTANGNYSCGKKVAKACPKAQSDRQGRTAMKIVPGTKSNDFDSKHVLRVPKEVADVLVMHMKFMREHEGLFSDEHLMFSGAVLPPKPVRWKRDTDESWQLRLDKWREKCIEQRRDGITIRTPDRDRAAWQAIQDSKFHEGEATNFDVHSIRHSTLAILASRPELTVMDIMHLANHANIETTMGYIQRFRPEGATPAMVASNRIATDYAASIGGSIADAAFEHSQRLFG